MSPRTPPRACMPDSHHAHGSKACNHRWGRGPMRLGICMPDSPRFHRPVASNQRGARGRCRQSGRQCTRELTYSQGLQPRGVRRPMQPINLRTPSGTCVPDSHQPPRGKRPKQLGVCMPDSHRFHRPMASNRRRGGGRCRQAGRGCTQ